MRILYATDGSEGALDAARLLSQLTLSADDEIEVLTATSDSAEAGAPDRIQQAVDALQGTPARIGREIRSGAAARTVLDRAEEWNANLIAVGSRGLNWMSRFLLGSVAERIVTHAPCAVLVGRPLRGALDQVVVGLDGSDASLEAARFVQEFPLPPGCSIRLATSIQFYQVGGTPADRISSLAAELRALQVRQREASEALLEEVAGSFRAGGRSVTTEFREQHPGDGLLAIADEQNADLVVVGRQGLSRVERFYMGSVSINVLRHASCSVLIVPEPRPED